MFQKTVSFSRILNVNNIDMDALIDETLEFKKFKNFPNFVHNSIYFHCIRKLTAVKISKGVVSAGQTIFVGFATIHKIKLFQKFGYFIFLTHICKPKTTPSFFLLDSLLFSEFLLLAFSEFFQTLLVL